MPPAGSRCGITRVSLKLYACAAKHRIDFSARVPRPKVPMNTVGEKESGQFPTNFPSRPRVAGTGLTLEFPHETEPQEPLRKRGDPHVETSEAWLETRRSCQVTELRTVPRWLTTGLSSASRCVTSGDVPGGGGFSGLSVA